MKAKRQVKPQQRNFFGFTRINKLNEDSSETNPIYHLLTPIANARVEIPTSKFVSVFGNQILIETDKEKPEKPTVNPLFKFHIFHIVLTDFISYDFKTTAYKVALLNDLTMYMNDQRDKKVVEQIRAVASQIVGKIFETKGLDVLSDIRQKGSRRQRLSLYKKLIDEKGEKYAKEYAEIKIKECKEKGEILTEEKVLLTKSYARTQIEIAKQIEPLRFQEQAQKLRGFCDTHKTFFGTELKMDNRYKPIRYSIKINSPSLATEPVLIRLDDFLKLREPNVDYRHESFIMARDILSDLSKYRRETSQSGKDTDKPECANYYEFLCPESVIVDQLTLRAKLSYELPVRNALGLKNKPCSTQCRLAFYCTPKEFDYYQSQAELDDQAKLILDDAHFGCIKMYNKLGKEHLIQIQKEKRHIEKLRQEICVDRFLLICHRMFYNEEFGRIRDLRTSYKKIKDHFSKALKDAKQSIKQNPQLLSIFIDPIVHKKRLEFFNFSFDQLLDFMSTDDSDSAVELLRYTKLSNFLSTKSAIAEKIINILKDQYFFSRISNVKKYIMLFFATGIQYLEELRACLAIEPACYEDIPKLRDLQRKGNRLKNRKGVEITLKNTFSKIEEYRTRREENQKEDTIRFLVNDELGKKLYEYVVDLNSKMQDQKSIQNDITNLINSKKKPDNYCKLLQKTVKDSLAMLDRDLTLFKEVMFQFCYPQLELRYKESPQRVPTFQQKETAKFTLEYYKQVSRRFGLILKAFLTCKPDNFIIYDTVLAKMLRFNQEQPKYTQASMITEQFIKTQRSILFSIDDLLSYTSTAPKAYKHLISEASKKAIEVAQSYRIDDDSIFVGSKFKNPNKYLKKEEGKDDDDEDYEKEDAVKIPQEDKFFKRQTWD